MGDIMNSPKGVKSGVPERVSRMKDVNCISSHAFYEMFGKVMKITILL